MHVVLVLPNHLFVSRLAVAPSIKEKSADAWNFLLHKNCKPWNKIEVAILNFDDVATFNFTLIAHLIFQIRK